MTRYLREKHLLLLLDNFEQILSTASLVADLLGACPRLAVLVTSRAVLHLRGEREFAVPPLDLPDPKAATPVEHLTEYAAVALFVQRAADVRADFSLTDDNAPAVAEICRRLDGLPLAIELAAARVKLLSARALLTRLERRLPVLTGGARDLPARQRTLRDAIAWSYDLLDEAEQALFRRLGVFVGGFSLEAIEAVGELDGALGMDAFEAVASLVDKSLLRREQGPAGEPRFRMLETILEYALERLEASGDAVMVRRRHAEHFLTLAEQAEPHLLSANADTWLHRLQAEHDNLRAALRWCLADEGDTETGVRIATAISRFWQIRSYLSEAWS